MSQKKNYWKSIAKLLFLSLMVVLAGIIVSDQFRHNTAQATVPASSQDLNNAWREMDNAFVQIAKDSKPAVVTVSTERELSVASSPFGADPFLQFFFKHGNGMQDREPQKFHQRGLGSGIIVSQDGTILTNNHVIDGADSIYVRTYNGERYTAKVVGADPKTDVAVIKIDAKNLTAMPIGNSDSLQVGEVVLAIGSPMSENLAYTVTQGIVSAKGRSNVGLADYEDFIQTDAAINPGNSGGPLVNLDGRLIGINSAIVSQSGGFQGIGFAVPVNMAMQVMNSLIKEGRVVRGWLGVSIQDVDDAIAAAMKLQAPSGALVGDVVNDSPASKAGLQAGDIIQSVNGQKVRKAADLRNLIASSAPGGKVTLQLMRSGQQMNVDVTLGEQPGSMASTQGEGSTSDLLGFRAGNSTDQLARQYGDNPDSKGVFVVSIDPNGPAYTAGMREGDLIHAVNRQPVNNTGDLDKITRNMKQGDYVLFQVERSGSMFFIAFRL